MIVDVLGVAYDKTQSFRRGASAFPELFWKYLKFMETYVNDVELSEELFLRNLGTVYPSSSEELSKLLEEKLRGVGEFLLVLGGEHSISYYVLRYIARKYNIESVLVLDAHPDVEENLTSHAGVVRRIASMLGEERIYLYGVRCFSKKEKEYLDRSRINILRSVDEIREIKGNVYLSVDFDVFDPSIIPCVGNPEPCGIKFEEYLEIVKAVGKKVVACDFVEFTPMKGISNSVYVSIALKAILHLLAEVCRR